MAKQKVVHKKIVIDLDIRGGGGPTRNDYLNRGLSRREIEELVTEIISADNDLDGRKGRMTR